ncbi:hypothetical protein [Roseiconus lacunae]|uniref:hypothetical protein n=1 Tax=Roseiconus lacunae TaxID=2605694 RepID=UPI001E5AAE86|nr:hypothetical protein [Roseiconus lacunae]
MPTDRAVSVEVGGVSRPITDVELPEMSKGQIDEFKKIMRTGVETTDRASGVIPEGGLVLKKGMDPSVDAAIESLRNKTNPERLSPTVLPGPFDLSAYRSNPKAYLDVAEPGRVWQTADPNTSKPLGIASPRMQSLKVGESIRLQVKTEPSAPVSFTSFDLGVFENKLPMVTVAANGNGIAEVAYTATPGTLAEVNILAGGPMSSGQVRFKINVTADEPAIAGRAMQ